MTGALIQDSGSGGTIKSGRAAMVSNKSEEIRERYEIRECQF